MSTETLRSEPTRTPSLPVQYLRTTARTVSAMAFWLAVALPFCYLPLLAGGLDSLSTQSTVGALLALNAVCLVLGHAHRRDGDGDAAPGDAAPVRDD
ncbi:hypothetical protein ACFPYI_11870 [Halomarina salina]|uniref:Uncharacterized protein n=1 Tax=Halomarina salina TaxID=1872699 RepID=A0ABD5RNY0_9EURY|nr:hypothetical protein [Halomarina salina]